MNEEKKKEFILKVNYAITGITFLIVGVLLGVLFANGNAYDKRLKIENGQKFYQTVTDCVIDNQTSCKAFLVKAYTVDIS